MNKKCAKLLSDLESQGRIKVWKSFAFPEPFDNGVRPRDILESNVDESFYIDDAKCAKLLGELQGKCDNPMFLNEPKYGKFKLRDICQTLTTIGKASRTSVVVPIITNVNGEISVRQTSTQRWRIRKLTPLECFRLQRFDDLDHAALVSAGISNSQLRKIAGNSITVSVLEGIFKALLCPSVFQCVSREAM